MVFNYLFHIYTRPITICSLFILFSSCVEPFSPSLNEQDTKSLLVVEGLITDEPGPFGVSLTTSIPVYDVENTVHSYYPPVSGAEVQIVDGPTHHPGIIDGPYTEPITAEQQLSGVITDTALTAGSGEPIMNLIFGNSRSMEILKQTGVFEIKIIHVETQVVVGEELQKCTGKSIFRNIIGNIYYSLLFYYF